MRAYPNLRLYLGAAALTLALSVAPYAWNDSLGLSSVLAANTSRDANYVSAANVLGSLRAANASANARQNAASYSVVDKISAYETEMRNALQVKDPAMRAAAIGEARRNLALTTNKQLTPDAIMRVDSLLRLPLSPPSLGTTAMRN